jgi:hypothetical protein
VSHRKCYSESPGTSIHNSTFIWKYVHFMKRILFGTLNHGQNPETKYINLYYNISPESLKMKYIYVLSCLTTTCINVLYKEQVKQRKVLFYCALSRNVPEQSSVPLSHFKVPTILRMIMSVN